MDTDEYNDEYIYDHVLKWDLEGYDDLPMSDPRFKWVKASNAFLDWLDGEIKKNGRNIMTMAPTRNVSIFAARTFISMKNWFNIMTTRGYMPLLLKGSAMPESSDDEEAHNRPETLKPTLPAPNKAPVPKPTPSALNTPSKKLPTKKVAATPKVAASPAKKVSAKISTIASPERPKPNFSAMISSTPLRDTKETSPLPLHSSPKPSGPIQNSALHLNSISPPATAQLPFLASSSATKQVLASRKISLPEADITSLAPPSKMPRTVEHENQQVNSVSYNASPARPPTRVDKALLKDLIDAEFTRHQQALEQLQQQIHTFQEHLSQSKSLLYRFCGVNE